MRLSASLASPALLVVRLLPLQRDRRYALGHSRRFCDLLLNCPGRRRRCSIASRQRSYLGVGGLRLGSLRLGSLGLGGLGLGDFRLGDFGVCDLRPGSLCGWRRGDLQRGRRRSSGFGLGTLCRRHRCDGRWLSRLHPVGAFQFALRLLTCCDRLFHGLFRSHCRRGRRSRLPGCLMCELGGGGLFGVRRPGVRRRGVRRRHAGARRRAGNRHGLPCHAWPGRVHNSFYFRLSRRHDVRLACLAVLSRRWPGPGHIGLTRPVARQPVDINDAGRIERICLQGSTRTEGKDQGQQSPFSRHDYHRLNAHGAGTGFRQRSRRSYDWIGMGFQEKVVLIRIAGIRQLRSQCI